MFRVARRTREVTARPTRRGWAGGLAIALLCTAAAQPANAQFRFFGEGEASTQDVYDTIGNQGFRMAGPLMRNGDVYIADVIDRRQRRERLIISRSSGQIVQRFFVDLNGRQGAYGAPPPGSGYGVPQRGPVARNDDSDFFSRMIRGWGEDAPPRPPAEIDNGPDTGAVMPPSLPRQQRIVRPRPSDIEPRVATRRDDAPIQSRPLPVPAPSSAPAVVPVDKQVPAAERPPAAPAPSTASTPVPATPPTRATVVNTDPLRIPGQRDADPAKSTPAAVAVKQPVAAPVPSKPVAAKAAPAEVPVAPLD